MSDLNERVAELADSYSLTEPEAHDILIRARDQIAVRLQVDNDRASEIAYDLISDSLAKTQEFRALEAEVDELKRELRRVRRSYTLGKRLLVLVSTTFVGRGIAGALRDWDEAAVAWHEDPGWRTLPTLETSRVFQAIGRRLAQMSLYGAALALLGTLVLLTQTGILWIQSGRLTTQNDLLRGETNLARVRMGIEVRELLRDPAYIPVLAAVYADDPVAVQTGLLPALSDSTTVDTSLRVLATAFHANPELRPDELLRGVRVPAVFHALGDVDLSSLAGSRLFFGTLFRGDIVDASLQGLSMENAQLGGSTLVRVDLRGARVQRRSAPRMILESCLGSGAAAAWWDRWITPPADTFYAHPLSPDLDSLQTWSLQQNRLERIEQLGTALARGFEFEWMDSDYLVTTSRPEPDSVSAALEAVGFSFPAGIQYGYSTPEDAIYDVTRWEEYRLARCVLAGFGIED